MSVEPAIVLRQLERERRTGVLRLDDGAFHLVGGAVTAAACRRATGLDRLVVETGVATAEDWYRAETGQPATLLESPRLAILALLSVFDAAYFLLPSASGAKFRPTQPHWLAPICRITPGTLVHEIQRRIDTPTQTWPAEWVERHPVVPVRRVRRRRVALTAGQAEVLGAADARRSVAAIAHDLGRTTYTCLSAVRDLTAAGLIEAPVQDIPAAETEQTTPTDFELAGPASVPDSSPPLDFRPAQPAPTLRRRTPSMTTIPDGDRWEPVDRNLLIRLRAALDELA
ncbi:DUF4388 domain-containing protein [Nocardia alni]|uniref:DUF4388 domain-containing protein n=1 Tax=Nocardia alni TaxID=2815723 RepID=UPI001C223429|nr:DUF4388 domain-containing protein [Nocardia alni]